MQVPRRVRVRFAGLLTAGSEQQSPTAGAEQQQRKSQRVRKAPTTLARPPSPPSPKKAKRPKRSDTSEANAEADGDALRKLKRQMREQSKELCRLQEMILHNQSLLLAQGVAGAAPPLALTAATVAPAAPPAIRGDMPFAERLALQAKIEKLHPNDTDLLKRSCLPTGMELHGLDLMSLDPALLWKLHDVCLAAASKRAAKRPAASRRPAARRTVGLEAACAATTRELAEVRAARAALATDTEWSEVASTYDAASEREAWEDAAALDEWDLGGCGEEAAEDLLRQLEGDD